MKKICNTCGVEKNANRTKTSDYYYIVAKGKYRAKCRDCRSAGEREKYKREERTKNETIEENPNGQFIAAVLRLARLDWEKYGEITGRTTRSHGQPTDLADATSSARRLGHENPRGELLAFFDSGHFVALCDVIGVDSEYVREQIL